MEMWKSGQVLQILVTSNLFVCDTSMLMKVKRAKVENGMMDKFG